jgi:hypothetical protein
MKLRAAAMAACLVGTGTAARAYDYVDSKGYRHWCQLSCERKGIHVPKPGEVQPGEVKSDEVKSGEVKSGEVKSGQVKLRQRKVIDENDLAWEPPPGVRWQVVPEKPSRAETKLFKPGEIAKQDKRP